MLDGVLHELAVPAAHWRQVQPLLSPVSAPFPLSTFVTLPLDLFSVFSSSLTLQTRGRSSVTRASARPSSRTPTPVSNSGVRSAMSSGASSSGLSAEQAAFLERKAREARDWGGRDG